MLLNRLDGFRICVVGSGFFGAVIAERVSRQLALPVLVVEKRSHFGGNSYSRIDDETGIEAHEYGSHIFHTSSEKVWDYVNTFSGFNQYRHRVLTTHRNGVYSMPINLDTINQFFGAAMTPDQARVMIAAEIAREAVSHPANFEEKGISLIGRSLYEAFIRGYSQKQWQTDLRSLPASIINRLPVRFHYNDRYFDDTYEGIPTKGYTGIFRSMLEHELVDVRLKTDFFDIRSELSPECLVVYTGPVDRFYDYQSGALGWRTLDFEREVVNTGDFQGTSVMNYADPDVPFTRIHEFRHFHPERRYQTEKSLIFREYSRSATHRHDEPYYPVNTESDRKLFTQYQDRMKVERNVVFGGRLATYQYLDMHQVIGSALAAFEKTIAPRLCGAVADSGQA